MKHLINARRGKTDVSSGMEERMGKETGRKRGVGLLVRGLRGVNINF